MEINKSGLTLCSQCSHKISKFVFYTRLVKRERNNSGSFDIVGCYRPTPAAMNCIIMSSLFIDPPYTHSPLYENVKNIALSKNSAPTGFFSCPTNVMR